MVEQKEGRPRGQQGPDELTLHRIDQPPKKGIHPAIPATVLVTITVILVVVLYIMVIRLAQTTGEQAPTGCFGEVRAASNTTASAEFCVFSVNPDPINLKIVLEADTSTGTYTFHSNTDWTILTLESGTDVGTITYRDFQDNGKASARDMLILSDLSLGTRYTLKMLWRDGSTLDTESFETPA